jgi:hypothetical protein
MDRERILADYQAIRAARYQLQTELAAREGRHIFALAAELGMTEGNAIVVDREDDAAYLMDHLIYDRLEQGKNLIERVYEPAPPSEGTPLRMAVDGMLRAHYGVVFIERREPGLGIHVHDIVRDEQALVVDIGLSHTATIGPALASRLLPYDGFCTLSGAGLPLLGGALETVERAVLAAFGRPLNKLGVLSREDDAKLAMLVFKIGWSLGANQLFATVGPGSRALPSPAAPWSGSKVGRNDPCPCGSGKKYKKCCAV